jgi:hypothetical protein
MPYSNKPEYKMKMLLNNDKVKLTLSLNQSQIIKKSELIGILAWCEYHAKQSKINLFNIDYNDFTFEESIQ